MDPMPAPTTTTNEEPRLGTLGRYRLVAALGAGGMAKVNLAVAQGPGGFNKLLVLKQIHDQYARDPEFVSMFLDEARLCARLQHPNVVQTNEVGEDDGRYFMAMEYLEGQSLGRLRARLGRQGLPLALHVQVLCDVLAGLHYAHELVDYDRQPLGVVHRDANPENIFITYDGAVKVMDFGIAKAHDQSSETVAGTIKGKVTFMPPEQARGDLLDRRADVFAAGVMLWEAATGVRMWKGIPQTTILRHLIHKEIPDARAVQPEIPDRLYAIICKACAPDRDDRYATAADLQADLEGFLAELGGRVHPRELGRLVASAFEDDRARLRARIQRHLHDAAEPAALTPRLPPASVSEPLTGRNSAGAVVGSVSARLPREPLLRRVLVAAAIVGVTLVAAGLAPVVTRNAAHVSVAQLAAHASNAAHAAGATSAAGAATGADAPAVPPVVTLRVWAKPASAQITFDGQAVDHNPFTTALRADENEHLVRVEASGYEPRSERFTLTKSRDLDVILDPSAPAPHPESSEAAAPAGSSAVPVKIAPALRRRLDVTNPYVAPHG
jgi:hypothetical protein